MSFQAISDIAKSSAGVFNDSAMSHPLTHRSEVPRIMIGQASGKGDQEQRSDAQSLGSPWRPEAPMIERVSRVQDGGRISTVSVILLRRSMSLNALL